MLFLQEIENIEDHRVDANKEYDLVDIIFLTVAAMLCGARGWKGIKIFGDTQLVWLRQYRDFNNGIPTRHSIGRIIRGIKAESLMSCFIGFSNQLREQSKRDHIAFDGKVIKGSKHGDEVNALQLMTAMVVESGLIIYQKETDKKTNEIPVMQSMLDSMNIDDAVITADAMHCQTETASTIREGNADYVLQVKSNQGNLCKEIAAYFHKAHRDTPDLIKKSQFIELDGEHGRINERHYRLLPITDWFDETEKFKDSYAVIEVERTRAMKNRIGHETSYYITSSKEDESKIYAEDGARNLATIRRALLNLIKEHPFKDSVAGKMQRACWDGEFRAEILFGHKSNKA
ncbi:ISAs1 family transposase [Photobacterium profundum]|uniref:Transposase n=1 Tax=Photobacterium profundum (strain SS9) TaxID=298386 RepID=Q6LTU3_PHOPR|nr:ISAs1 family transposase [Photobacterium profundum]CAG19282.1 conserved hypothetical protein [Photobacterium profundum SS9]